MDHVYHAGITNDEEARAQNDSADDRDLAHAPVQKCQHIGGGESWQQRNTYWKQANT